MAASVCLIEYVWTYSYAITNYDPAGRESAGTGEVIEAARRKTTLTALVEEGLHRVIKDAYKPVRRKKVVLPVSKRTGGTWPGIDINNSAELLDIMDGYLDPSRR